MNIRFLRSRHFIPEAQTACVPGGSRNLGLGSSRYYTDSLNNQDLRYGDMKLEFNGEYRFLLGNPFRIQIQKRHFYGYRQYLELATH